MTENKNPFSRAASIADEKFAALIEKKPVGRKPAKQPDVIDLEKTHDQSRIDGAAIIVREEAQALALADQQHAAHVRAVAASVGYLLPADCADPDLIQRDIASNMRRTAEAMFQVGLGLVVLKEACRHGEFLARLDVLGFEPTAAQRYMQVARKLSNAATSRHLLKAVESQSKLLELIVLDDEQLEEFALTGQVGDLKRDDVDGMSVRELRKRVRELTLEKKADEDRIAVKDRQRNEAEEQARGFKKLPADDQVDALLAEAGKTVNAALARINGEFRQALLAIEALDQSAAGIKDYRPLAAGLVGQLQQSITIIRDEFMLTDIVADGVPEWMRATAHLVDGE